MKRPEMKCSSSMSDSRYTAASDTQLEGVKQDKLSKMANAMNWNILKYLTKRLCQGRLSITADVMALNFYDVTML